MRLFCLIFVLAIIGTQYAGGKDTGNIRVFWVPPEVETYVPVTDGNIEEMAFKVVIVKNSHQADQITSLIHKSEQEADSKRIRVKIVTGDKFYNFDSNGLGVSSEGQSVAIDLKRLKIVLCE
jgi:hypothetical protein